MSTKQGRALLRSGVATLAVVAITCVYSASSAAAASTSSPGIGTAAALSAPNCDSTTKRIKLYFYAAPPCVKPWQSGADNGGATAQGVTKDAVKVVVTWTTPTSTTKGNVVNQATGQDPASERDAINDANAMLKSVYQTWGRTVDLQFVETTGEDEASQRADAVKVAAMKPFAVIDFASTYGGGGGLVFNTALQGKVPTVNVIPPKALNNPVVLNAAEWTGKALVGGKAKWAGDTSMQNKTRVFGVVYPSGDTGIDLPVFTKEFARYGGKAAVSAGYDNGLDQSQAANRAQEQAPTIITKLKSAGVTTVVNFGDGVMTTPALMKAATAQDYHPEWIVTGFGYQDIDVVGRLSDQTQMAHAFGVIWFVPYAAGTQDPFKALFQWYWGTDKGTQSVGALSSLQVLYNGIQLAGPKLTADTYRAGLRKFPPTGGAYSNFVSNLEVSYRAPKGQPPPRGSAVGWYSTDTTGPSQIIGTGAIAPGKYMYLDGGKRYIHGDFPKGEPKLFDKSNSISQLDSIPAGELPPQYPCTDCPSSGGGPAPSSSTS